MHIMDIFQNSVRAHSSFISLVIEEDVRENLLVMTICDNGSGMDEAMVKKSVDPFVTTRSTRKVGLGLPLLKQNAERTGGSFTLVSQEGIGTKVVARFIHNHPDRPSNGDVAGAFLLSCTSRPDIEFQYKHVVNGTGYQVSSSQLKDALGEISISDPVVYSLLYDMVSENIKLIGAN